MRGFPAVAADDLVAGLISIARRARPADLMAVVATVTPFAFDTPISELAIGPTS